MNKKKNISSAEIEELLLAEQNETQRHQLMRFFKTGKGEYGEGDKFLGLKVPQTRAVVKEAKLQVSLEEIEKLLYSPWHEVRLCGLLLLVEEMNANLPKKNDNEAMIVGKSLQREKIARFYLIHARQANNWDLVDLSCQYILGPFMRLSTNDNHGILCRLADSENLWEQRIAIVTTLNFIRHGIYDATLTLCDRLINHSHDLIHKAMGWMLREIGKKDIRVLTDYLERNYSRLSRTSLRYAIERMPEPKRLYWLRRK